MKAHQHIQAGIIVIDDLPITSKCTIRDSRGRIVKQLLIITPTITLDIENWLSGWYSLIAVASGKRECLRLRIG